MPDWSPIAAELAWPLALVIAWTVGEIAQRWMRIPRISSYALTGFALSLPQIQFLPTIPTARVLLLAKIALGLILFEAGYRINLRWLRANPWLLATSLAESGLTFWLVHALVRAQGLSSDHAMLLAAVAMATSPATVVRVINESRASGQVTERILHLSALNTTVAILVFKIVAAVNAPGVSAAAQSGVPAAAQDTLLVLLGAILSGMIMGAFVPAVLKAVRRTAQDSTVAYALAVVLLVAVNHALQLSPFLAALTFGLVSRHRRVFLTPSQRGFGSLGELLGVLLFTFAAVAVEWRHLTAGIGLGLAIVVVRLVAKAVGVAAFAFVSGTSWSKGALTGLALMPMSAVLILVLEGTPELGLALLDVLAALATASLLAEVFGPIALWRALQWASEVRDLKEG